MPRVKWGIDASEPEDLEAFDVYDGPVPPRGVYAGVVTRLQIKENKNGDDMLNGLWVIKTTDPDKKRYNGCAIWFNQNVTEQGSPYVKQFLKSMGLTWDQFIKQTVTDSNDRPANVKSIGRTKFNDGNEVPCRALVRPKKAQPGYPGGDPDIGQWLMPKDEDDSAWEDDEADEADETDEDPFA